MADLLKLNLGCGYNRREGYVNVDREPACGPDVVLNLAAKWPWRDGSVGEVVLHHVLEHIYDLPAFMAQLYVVCAPGALIQITVPHHRSDGFAGDPTHVHPITIDTMRLFSRKACGEFAEKGWPNTRLADYLDVDFEVEPPVEYKVNPAWKTLPNDVLERAAAAFANVIDEVTIRLRRL